MNAHEPHRPSTATISLVVLIVVTFFTALYMKGLNSGIPLYYDSIGYSATVGGTFVAVFTLASTAMRLVGGQFTDHFSHFKVLLVSLAGLLVGVALPAVWDAFAVVMVARVIQGASFALATNVMTVAVMGSASKKHLGRRVGLKGAGTSLGTMLGALVATGLLDGVGYHGFYAFYAVLMVLAIVAIILLNRFERSREDSVAKRETPKALTDVSRAKREHSASMNARSTGEARVYEARKTDSESTKTTNPVDADSVRGASPVGDAESTGTAHTLKGRIRALIQPYLFPQVAPYLAISFARRVPKGLCISFVLVFAKHAGIAMGAAFFVAAGATTLLCRLFGGKLFDSQKHWLLFPLISVQVIGFAILAVAPSFATLMVAAVGYGISVGTTSPFVKTITAKATPKEHWGVVNGEVYFFGDMGKAAGAFCGGLLLDATAKTCLPEVALGFALLTSAITGISLLIGRHIKKSA